MRNHENELDQIGAEALPGGLQEFSATRGDVPTPSASPPSPPPAPLVGLVNLMRYWMDRTRSRR